jgi:hypothetical protein
LRNPAFDIANLRNASTSCHPSTLGTCTTTLVNQHFTHQTMSLCVRRCTPKMKLYVTGASCILVYYHCARRRQRLSCDASMSLHRSDPPLQAHICHHFQLVNGFKEKSPTRSLTWMSIFMRSTPSYAPSLCKTR